MTHCPAPATTAIACRLLGTCSFEKSNTSHPKQLRIAADAIHTRTELHLARSEILTRLLPMTLNRSHDDPDGQASSPRHGNSPEDVASRGQTATVLEAIVERDHFLSVRCLGRS